MSKIRKIFLSLNYPLLVFLAYSIRMTVLGSSFADSLVLLVLCLAFIGFYISKRYFFIKQQVISENNFRLKVQNDIQAIQNEVSRVKLGVGKPTRPF